MFNCEDQSTQFQDWSDYTEADIVFAVRNATEYDLTLKPALKLINAWFAGCPAILGPEPGYQALRKSELDYFEVCSPEEAVAAVRRLKDNPALYAAMVQNGYERAKEFTTEQLAERWRDLLADPIATGYERWLQQSTVQKVAGRPIQFAWRVQQHKQNHRHYLFHRDNGPRLFKIS